LEREIYQGELSSLKNASLPLFGALGGMVVPAFIFFIFNFGAETLDGIGVPMATDIAFAIGILSLLGKRVPSSLKMFLLALAVIDDLGAIIIIAIFYTKTVVFFNLAIALGVMGVLFVLNRMKVHNLIPYLVGGVVMWYFMLQSGVHATISGVLLAFVIPFGGGGEKSASYILQDFLDKPVAFIILPLFALANTSITLGDAWLENLTEANSLGIIFGLAIGKPLGIWLFSFFGSVLGLCMLPSDLKWKNILGAGFLGGIGFTMSIFITLLAYEDIEVINSSKMAILLASCVSGLVGYFWLRFTLKKE
ncbi:MAG TPA: Na+/H+ antiporter NhaA, partial [Flavobacteriaceae bacterium]|nr:Na+/H+ antiporter NhaA [Flavobacteriaceae bacterium]